MTIVTDNYKGTEHAASISLDKNGTYRAMIYIPNSDHIIDASNTVFDRIYPTRDKAMAAIRRKAHSIGIELTHIGI